MSVQKNASITLCHRWKKVLIKINVVDCNILLLLSKSSTSRYGGQLENNLIKVFWKFLQLIKFSHGHLPYTQYKMYLWLGIILISKNSHFKLHKQFTQISYVEMRWIEAVKKDIWVFVICVNCIKMSNPALTSSFNYCGKGLEILAL